MARLALAVLGDVLLGDDYTRQAESISEAQTILLEEALRRMTSPLHRLAKRTGFSGRSERAEGASHELDRTASDLVSHARSAGAKKDDLLTRLAAVDSSCRLSEDDLRDTVKTILFAGSETTSVALSWAWYLIGHHPEAGDGISREAEEAREPSELVYTRKVFSEALRLYPSVPVVQRACLEDVTIGGQSFAKGQHFSICPYVTHRHAAYWDLPEDFSPSRFDAEPEAGAYIPFLRGKRWCKGEHLARLEGVMVLAALARRLRLRLVDQRAMDTKPILILRMARPLMALIEER